VIRRKIATRIDFYRRPVSISGDWRALGGHLRCDSSIMRWLSGVGGGVAKHGRCRRVRDNANGGVGWSQTSTPRKHRDICIRPATCYLDSHLPLRVSECVCNFSYASCRVTTRSATYHRGGAVPGLEGKRLQLSIHRTHSKLSFIHPSRPFE
jgi:hypothetical protein